jgi:flagellar protein FliO/FliZ
MHEFICPVDRVFLPKPLPNKKKVFTVTNSRIVLFPPGLVAWSFSNAVEAAEGGGNGIAGGAMLQVVLGLILVLALMAGLAWLLKRAGGMQRDTAGAIRVMGGAMVGQRERVVLLEVADTWLIVGVAPGHVTALHSMPKGEIGKGPAGETVSGARFSTWLQQIADKRSGKAHD